LVPSQFKTQCLRDVHHVGRWLAESGGTGGDLFDASGTKAGALSADIDPRFLRVGLRPSIGTVSSVVLSKSEKPAARRPRSLKNWSRS
jgi:hypothetical protein